ncbi:MAG: hypothetical protein WKF84_17195 [Pyrinomonadaceae bacterium]
MELHQPEHGVWIEEKARLLKSKKTKTSAGSMPFPKTMTGSETFLIDIALTPLSEATIFLYINHVNMPAEMFRAKLSPVYHHA